MERKKTIRHFRDLEVYQRAFAAAMEIFQITKQFPANEKYSLVDQIRRSSRSVCSCIAEAWRKRKYTAVFTNKLTDAMQEGSETQCWLEFSDFCGYINKEVFNRLDIEYEHIVGMLMAMEKKAETFCY